MDVTVFCVILAIAVFVCLTIGCSSAGTVRQRTDTEGADSGELLERDQGDIRAGVNRIGDSTAELARRVEQSVGTVEVAEKRVVGAAEYSEDIARGLDDSLFLVGEIGDGLDQLEGILRELEKRTGLTDGVGDKEGSMD